MFSVPLVTNIMNYSSQNLLHVVGGSSLIAKCMPVLCTKIGKKTIEDMGCDIVVHMSEI